jgi:hypothetical protein
MNKIHIGISTFCFVSSKFFPEFKKIKDKNHVSPSPLSHTASYASAAKKQHSLIIKKKTDQHLKSLSLPPHRGSALKSLRKLPAPLALPERLNP